MDIQTIVHALHDATKGVFSTMLGMEVTPGEAIDHEDPEPVNGVIALLGFTGPWVGTGMLYCSEQFARHIGSKMLMAEVHEVNADVLDGIGEMANMVLGNFKENMFQHTGALSLSIPTVVWGKNFSTRTSLRASWVIVPFTTGDDLFEVRVCMKNKEVVQS
jgi:chemotaxis protein CheX